MTREDIKTINDIVHKTIYGFFDVCSDEEETPMTDKDKLLLEVNKAVCNNIKDLEQEPCGDAISRQAALEKIHWLGLDNDTTIKCDLAIRALSPVNTQEPTTGHWEWVQYDYNPQLGNWYCSECKCVVVECVDKNEKGGIPLYKYCPQCGAKIESEGMQHE